MRIISGHYHRINITDIGKHLERGARLLLVFAELGNFFPLLESLVLKLSDCFALACVF